ncbi:MAG TPA: hypothetical protein VIU41_09495, partial [Geobacteraceae bacterium]
DRKAAFWANSVHQNTGFDLVYAGSEELALGGNWWGGGGAPKVEIQHQTGSNGGRVQLEPLLDRNPLAEP